MGGKGVKEIDLLKEWEGKTSGPREDSLEEMRQVRVTPKFVDGRESQTMPHLRTKETCNRMKKASKRSGMHWVTRRLTRGSTAELKREDIAANNSKPRRQPPNAGVPASGLATEA